MKKLGKTPYQGEVKGEKSFNRVPWKDNQSPHNMVPIFRLSYQLDLFIATANAKLGRDKIQDKL